ncbi:MAG: hypothetical protein PSV18_06635, partial [Methylobacter sp.]|nr:hypothetical protein [Candidatus Methylobacter titanis]
MEENKGGYICQFCGHTSASAAAGSCSNSPHNKHVYIAKKSSRYTCKFCGHEVRILSGKKKALLPFSPLRT